MIMKFNPAGRVLMVLGRRAEARRGAGGGVHPGDAAAARASTGIVQSARPTSPGIRERQHLHRRRLQQLARREDRQERPTG